MDNPVEFQAHPQAKFGIIAEMNDGQFVRWKSLLEERIGMTLAPHRKPFLQANLSTRMRALSCQNYDDYYKKVTRGLEGAIEWSSLVDHLTVQETRFFRDADALFYVKQYLQDKGAIGQSSIDIWSMGCSSGEEVYGLAMLADQYLSGTQTTYSITGTDLSTVVLRKAKQGIYSARKLATLPIGYQQQYCEKINDSEYQISKSLRNRTCFAQVNALNIDAFPLQGLDIIYCQNVLIYFRRWRRKEILNALAERLAPGGILIIGLGEALDWQHPNLAPVNSNKISAYVRLDNK